jgi:hypothetical protein
MIAKVNRKMNDRQEELPKAPRPCNGFRSFHRRARWIAATDMGAMEVTTAALPVSELSVRERARDQF